MVWVDRIMGIAGALAALAAAVLWLRAASVEIPDNIDTIVGELQRAALWNSYASYAAVVAALCATWAFTLASLGAEKAPPERG